MTMIIVLIFFCWASFLFGALSMREHLTGHWLPRGRWCGTCHTWERDFNAHIFWCHPSHADSTTPGPEVHR